MEVICKQFSNLYFENSQFRGWKNLWVHCTNKQGVYLEKTGLFVIAFDCQFEHLKWHTLSRWLEQLMYLVIVFPLKLYISVIGVFRCFKSGIVFRLKVNETFLTAFILTNQRGYFDQSVKKWATIGFIIHKISILEVQGQR